MFDNGCGYYLWLFIKAFPTTFGRALEVGISRVFGGSLGL